MPEPKSSAPIPSMGPHKTIKNAVYYGLPIADFPFLWVDLERIPVINGIHHIHFTDLFHMKGLQHQSVFFPLLDLY